MLAGDVVLAGRGRDRGCTVRFHGRAASGSRGRRFATLRESGRTGRPGCGRRAGLIRLEAEGRGSCRRRRGGGIDAAEIQQGGQDVLHLGGGGDVARVEQAAGGPSDEAGDAVAALVVLGFVAAHARVVELDAGGAAVVGHPDEDGVVAQAGFLEEGFEPAHVFVDVGDHAEEVGGASDLS